MGKTTLRRYTDLAATIHILKKKSITFLDPETWDDRNDSYFMSQYKLRKKAKSVLALCFAEVSETSHHWSVFSRGSAGVCLEFDMDKLLSGFEDDTRIISDWVEYKKIDQVRNAKPKLKELPFLKRFAYEDEQEFRVIYVDKETSMDSKNHKINLDCIVRITLSPWIPHPFLKSVREIIRAIDGCEDLDVYRSTLIENERWKKAASEPQFRVRSRRKSKL